MKSFILTVLVSTGLVFGLAGCKTMQQQPQFTQAQQAELTKRKMAVEKADAEAAAARADAAVAKGRKTKRRAQRRVKRAEAVALQKRKELIAYEQELTGTSSTTTVRTAVPAKTKKTYSAPQNQNTREGLHEAAGTVRDVRGLVNEIRSLRHGW